MDKEKLNPEEEIEVIIEDEEVSDEETAEEDAPAEGTPLEETPAEEEPEEEKPEDKTVPLAALRREREKTRNMRKENDDLKRAMSRVMEGAGVSDPKALEERMDNLTLQKFVEQHGMDENTARMFLLQQKKIKELEAAQGGRDFDGEIQQLRDNPFYGDIDEVADEVTSYADEKNLTVREAYNALFGEQRAKVLSEEAAAGRAEQKKQDKKIPALSSAGNAPSPKNKVKLTTQELAFAEAGGMSPAEYAKYRKK